MKTLKYMPLFCLLLFFNCSGQNKDSKAKNGNSPDENISVNKEYDEHGNLIKYDSIYSYSYSSNGKTPDSLKLKFQKHFNSHSFFNDAFFDDFFQKDSISNHFDYENFFYDGFMNQDEHIKNMMRRMDSIQQLFFNQQQKPIIPAEPEKSRSNTKNMALKQI
ncbi:hypothetical protein KFZ70_14800 [Tamlana fucoidanivorans]|uniref:Uncharacterized protein n=1 Tax=Allotamlana fucoidanivorans TaxID=2583814 RepID=A0A5C4SHG0_9FLAO|nr:hypothetical protein [Tamlana fucoidanivorans]TNJ42440.1 hypothetical protein FGF67_14330 [Tamlana fucoidanivorans]